MTKSDIERDYLTCFEDLVVGQSKRANWYQYGFSVPQVTIFLTNRFLAPSTKLFEPHQGPIPGKRVSGLDVREFSNYLMFKYGIEPLQPKDQKVIVIFLRMQNRRILNYEELAQALEERFSLPVQVIQSHSLFSFFLSFFLFPFSFFLFPFPFFSFFSLFFSFFLIFSWHQRQLIRLPPTWSLNSLWVWKTKVFEIKFPFFQGLRWLSVYMDLFLWCQCFFPRSTKLL